MLTIEKTALPSPLQWEIIIEGMRNPMNSWELSDSEICINSDGWEECHNGLGGVCPRGGAIKSDYFCMGKNDHKLMMQLVKGGSVHAKYRRMIPVFVTITAPRYWWAEYDTYKVGTVVNSCSTMHKLHEKDLTMDDFSHEHLDATSTRLLETLINYINFRRDKFVKNKLDKNEWWQLIQLLPSSYNQRRTVMLNYEVLANIYHSRKGHKLDCWHTFCEWIESLPYSEIITGSNNGERGE